MLQDFWSSWGTIITWIGLVTVVGLIIDTAIYGLLSQRAKRRHQRVGQVIARALHGLPTAFAVLIGIRIGSVKTDLPTEQAQFVSTLLLAGFIIVLTAFSSRVAGRLIRFYTSRDDDTMPSSTIFVNFARGIIWIIGSLTLLAAFEVSIAPLLTALGVGGLAVGLALQDTLANLFAGIQVLLSGQIKPGDYIRLESMEEGWVTDVTWRNTTIKMLSNDLVIVPNSKLGSELVVNYTQVDTQHVVWVDVGVAYDSDLDLVEHVTLDVANSVANASIGADPEYDSLVRFNEFGDSSINLRVSLLVNDYNERWPVQTAMIKGLHKRYAEENITIPFPQRTVHMANDGAGVS